MTDDPRLRELGSETVQCSCAVDDPTILCATCQERLDRERAAASRLVREVGS